MDLWKMKRSDEILAEDLRDPGFRSEWERSALGRLLAQRLIEYRAAHGLSQTALARMLGMHQPAIARIEAGDHTPSVDTLIRIARGLDVELRLDVKAQGSNLAVRPSPGALTTVVPPPPQGWALMRVPKELRMGPVGIAEVCQWTLRGRKDGLWEVRLREHAWSSPRAVFQPQLLVRASSAHRQEHYARLAQWPTQDAYLPPAKAQEAATEVERLLDTHRRQAAWAAFTLQILVASQEELPHVVRGFYENLASQLPKSSIWTISVDPVIQSRRAALRTQVAVADAPELLERRDVFEGLRMSSHLGNMDSMAVGSIMQTPLLALAPGLLGIVATRTAGLVVVLFGQIEEGRPSVGPTSMIDMYRPNLLSQPVIGAADFERPRPSDIEELVTWWCDRLNALYGVLLDPSSYRLPDSMYDAAGHYGDLLSFDRLVCAVNSVLVGSRREEFARRLMLFEALDILDGFRLGSYRALLDRTALLRYLEQLRRSIPQNLHRFFLPRCEAAIEALTAVGNGWYIRDRVGPKGLTVSGKAGQLTTLPIELATADYIRLVRNAGHSLRESTKDPVLRSLLVSHTGELGPEISDIAFLHFLRLITNPELLRPRLDRGTL